MAMMACRVAKKAIYIVSWNIQAADRGTNCHAAFRKGSFKLPPSPILFNKKNVVVTGVNLAIEVREQFVTWVTPVMALGLLVNATSIVHLDHINNSP